MVSGEGVLGEGDEGFRGDKKIRGMGLREWDQGSGIKGVEVLREFIVGI